MVSSTAGIDSQKILNGYSCSREKLQNGESFKGRICQLNVI